MPVIKGSKHKEVPPVVRMATPVNFSNEPTFGYFSDINNKGDDNKNVHADDAWNENLKPEKVKIIYT